MLAWPVITTISARSSCLRSWMRSKPVPSGRMRSSSTTSGGSASSRPRASRRLPAVWAAKPCSATSVARARWEFLSSSTTRAWSTGLTSVAERRQAQAERAAPSRRIGDADLAAVRFDDRARHVEADAGAAGLGGDVQVEDARVQLLRDAGPAIGDQHFRAVGEGLQPELERAAFGHRLQGVDGDVEDGLLEPVALAGDAHRRPRQVGFESHVLQACLRQQQPLDLPHHGAGVELLARTAGGGGLGEQRKQRAVEALELLAQDGEILLAAFGFAHGVAAVAAAEGALQQVEVEHHGVERRLEVMGDGAVNAGKRAQLAG